MISVDLILITVFSVGIWYLLFIAYPKYKLDLFRESVFTLRNQLFDAAADGLIEFDHDAYRMLRSTNNGFIRFGHRLSILQMIVVWKVPNQLGQESIPSYEDRWKSVTHGMDSDVLGQLAKFRNELNFLTVKYLITKSPMFVIINVVLVPLVLIFILFKNPAKAMSNLVIRASKGILKELIDEIESAALIEGENPEYATT